MQQNQPNRKEKENQEKDNPALSKVIERNIRTIIRLRLKAADERGLQDRIADVITSFSGRMVFAYVHIVWFGGWILLNTGNLGVRPFDPFPYGLLTMIVSLEAIFLSTFVMIGQNRQASFQQAKADHDFNEQELELKTNTELTRAIHALTAELHRRLVEGSAHEG